MKTISLLACIIMLGACSSTIANRNPIGESFPKVEGERLSGEQVVIPDAFEGKQALLLIGYKMDSQFDIDRWLLGLAQAEVDLPAYEVPATPKLLAQVFQNQIDEGMRSGIPRPEWDNVITVYGDADEIVQFLGNVNPRNARVLLLDENGTVIWFHDDGYSANVVLDLKEKAASE